MYVSLDFYIILFYKNISTTLSSVEWGGGGIWYDNFQTIFLIDEIIISMVSNNTGMVTYESSIIYKSALLKIIEWM